MLHYPLDFPADAAMILVKNFRAGTLGSEKAASSEAAWNLVGYGLKETVGESSPTGNILAGSGLAGTNPNEILSGDCPPDEEMIAALETYGNLSPDKKLQSGLPLDMKTLIKWALSLAIRIITGVTS